MQKYGAVLFLMITALSGQVFAHDFSCRVNKATDLFTQKTVTGTGQSFTVNTHSGKMTGDIQTGSSHQPVVLEKAKGGTLKILDATPASTTPDTADKNASTGSAEATDKTANSGKPQAADIKYISIDTRTRTTTRPFFYMDNHVLYTGECQLVTHS